MIYERVCKKRNLQVVAVAVILFTTLDVLLGFSTKLSYAFQVSVFVLLYEQFHNPNTAMETCCHYALKLPSSLG